MKRIPIYLCSFLQSLSFYVFLLICFVAVFNRMSTITIYLTAIINYINIQLNKWWFMVHGQTLYSGQKFREFKVELVLLLFFFLLLFGWLFVCLFGFFRDFYCCCFVVLFLDFVFVFVCLFIWLFLFLQSIWQFI